MRFFAVASNTAMVKISICGCYHRKVTSEELFTAMFFLEANAIQ